VIELRLLRGTLAALVALTLSLAGCGGGSTEDSGEPRAASARLSGAARGWNLVLVSIDTVRADRLGAYGYDRRQTSPRSDALILDAGARFERAMAPRGATWPSLATVLTGLYPTGHGVIRNGYEFPDEVPTLPKILREAGYQTGAFINNMQRANHQGWDEFSFARGSEGRLVRQAQQWMRKLDPDRPFFLWTHFFGPHSPYHQAKLLEEIPGVDPSYDGPVKMGKVALDRILREEIPLEQRDLEQLNAFYDGALLATDQVVGRLLDGLRSTGRFERTLLVYVSDHGEDLYEHHRYLYHACSPYQTTLHVPLAIVAPGLLDPATVIDQPVELGDVMPTVLDLLGVETPEDQHGVSLVRLLERPDTPGGGRPAFSEYDDTAIRTVMDDSWKLIVNPDEIDPVCVPGAPDFAYPIERFELYDLASDPGETTNLAAQNPEIVERLRRLIEDRFSDLTDRSQTQEIPEDLRRELEALGYVAD
jgi:arylsulfatase A-like enzyme